MTSPPDANSEASVDLASRSDVGQVRSANEDSCDVFMRGDGARLLIVADGMGGHRGGATASGTVVSTVGETFIEAGRDRVGASPAEVLSAAIRGANAKVYAMAQQDPALEGMGTTVVAFHLSAGFHGTVAHVGDSRAYRLRGGQLDPITTDHSVVAEMQRRGLLSAEEAAVHPRRNEILRSVGVQPEVEIEVSEVDVQPGDRFLLCSDGLSGMVSDPEIAAVLQSELPDAAVTNLIRLANERGGPDNITVQILAVPAGAIIEGDPEATADVELSDFGMEQIASRRRERQLKQRLLGGAALVALFIVVYFAFGWLRGDASDPRTAIQSGTPGARDLRPPPRQESANPNPSRTTATETDPDRGQPDAQPSPRPPETSQVPSTAPAPPSAAPRTESAPSPDAEGTPPDRFEIDREEPRRGIPRPGA